MLNSARQPRVRALFTSKTVINYRLHDKTITSDPVSQKSRAPTEKTSSQSNNKSYSRNDRSRSRSQSKYSETKVSDEWARKHDQRTLTSVPEISSETITDSVTPGSLTNSSDTSGSSLSSTSHSTSKFVP